MIIFKMKVVLFVILSALALVNAEDGLFQEDFQIDNVIGNALGRMFTRTAKKSQERAERIVIDRNIVDDKIIALLESAREQFNVGFPESGIPPLDPFTLDNVTYNTAWTHADEEIFNVDILVKNLKVVGLQDFIVENINFKIIGLSLAFELIVPDLVLTTSVEVNANILDIIDIYPSLDATVTLNNFTISGNAVLGTTLNGTLLLKSLDIEFDARATSATVENLFKFDRLNGVVNFALSQLSDEFFEGQREGFGTAVSEGLFDIIGDYIKDIVLSDLIG